MPEALERRRALPKLACPAARITAPGPARQRVDIAMMRTPDGHGRLELTKFHRPKAIGAEPENPPANTLGIRRIMFAVDDIEHVIARLHTQGAELVGDLEQFEDSHRLCHVRGPEGIIVAPAEQLS